MRYELVSSSIPSRLAPSQHKSLRPSGAKKPRAASEITEHEIRRARKSGKLLLVGHNALGGIVTTLFGVLLGLQDPVILNETLFPTYSPWSV